MKKWVRWVFETAIGEWVLARLERWTGLGVVPIEDLAPEDGAA